MFSFFLRICIFLYIYELSIYIIVNLNPSKKRGGDKNRK